MALVVGNEEVAPNDEMRWLAFEHKDFPTLILTEDIVVNWHTLAETLSEGISHLIDGRLRSVEPILLRLAVGRSRSDKLEAPSDEALASALKCDVQTVQDICAELRTGLEHILHLLIPLVGYYAGNDLALQLMSDFERAENGLDVHKWLEEHLSGEEGCAPDKLIYACEHAANRDELPSRLGLHFAKFNRVLSDLDEQTVSKEPELRQLYNAYLKNMEPKIIYRLRCHHFADFRDGRDLAVYLERKSLNFLAFDKDWILTRETLEMEAVKAHITRLLADTLGEEGAPELPEYRPTLEANRKAVRKFAMQAAPVIGVWCQRKKVQPPEPWKQVEPQAVVRYLENSGLLDFELIDAADIPSLCRRATCWPEGMPEILEGSSLGLTKDDVRAEKKCRERERQQKDIERRSISFAQTSLDTGDPKFAENVQEMVTGFLTNDETWFERSQQRPHLVKYGYSEKQGRSGGANGKGRATKKRERQLTDPQRQAMGLVSEYLAYHFLLKRHSQYVDESCWISTNRANFFGGDEGDDSAGFDFRVQTQKVDWLYEVKSSLEDNREFELTANELQVAGSASKEGRRRYRVLYVSHVFTPEKWYVLELPNPMGEVTRNRFITVGRGSVRLRFERG